MKKPYKIACAILLCLAICVASVFYFSTLEIPVLQPKGIVGLKQKDLLIASTLLMLIVVFPVLVLGIWFGCKYHEGNKKATYSPNWDFNAIIETIWWVVPCVIIFLLSVMTWKSSHELDPFKPLASNEKPLTIQVVALQWKWLFIYPEQGIATLSFIQFPEKTPIHFEITSDAPMNSFWIPELGGQIYAMSGMKSELHLISDIPGDFRGCSANLSGEGFAGMRFIARSSSKEAFDLWVSSIQASAPPLNYQDVLPASKDVPPTYFKLENKELFNEIIMKYMMPMDHKEMMHHE